MGGGEVPTFVPNMLTFATETMHLHQLLAPYELVGTGYHTDYRRSSVTQNNVNMNTADIVLLLQILPRGGCGGLSVLTSAQFCS